MNLAEINIARLRAPIDDPLVAPFMNALDKVNGIAERSEGFVWRLKDDSGNATELNYSDDPYIISNASVWRDLPSLQNFVFNTVHKQFMQRKSEWFEILETQHFVMWNVEEGHQPTLDEARIKIALFDQKGASADAFDWEWARLNL